MAELVANRPPSATVVTGGSRGRPPGFFFQPTLIRGLSNGDELVHRGDLRAGRHRADLHRRSDAIAKANSVSQGLASSVWTRDLARGLRVIAIDTGIVWVNTHMVVGPDVPLGGFRASGLGKEGGLAGLEEFTRTSWSPSALPSTGAATSLVGHPVSDVPTRNTTSRNRTPSPRLAALSEGRHRPP